MALKLWMGPSGSGKTRFLFEYVIKEAREHNNINYIVIVPEQYTLSTQKEIIKLSPGRGILNIDVVSFKRLAENIFDEVGYKDAKGIAIDDMGKNLILRHIAASCEEKLSVFKGKMDKLGYITEIKSAISEFMQYGISVEKLPEMTKAAKDAGRGQLAAKLSDMEILYREFNAFVNEKYITNEEFLNKARRSAVKSKKLKKSVVVFDGFTGFTPVQYSFIETLLQITRDMHVTILTDTRDNITYNTKHELFYLGFSTENKLKKLAELNNITIDNDFIISENVPRRFWKDYSSLGNPEVTSERLVHLERNLFREYSKPYEGAIDTTPDTKKPTKVVNSGIAVFSALQPIDEVRRVAVEIQKLIRNDDIRYKNIAVAAGDLETYAPLFRRIFAEYKIPYFIDRTFPILMNPFIEYIRALIDIVTEDFSYSSVFRYLKLPFDDFETVDIDRLENFVLKHGIKGASAWMSDWKEKYKCYYKNTVVNSENEVDEELISLDIIRAKVIEDLKEIVNLITECRLKGVKVPTKAVNEMNAVFTRVFETHFAKERIQLLYKQYSETDGIFKREHEKEYELIYNKVIDLLNRLGELLGEEEITIKEYGELLDAGFDEIRVEVIPSITDYIQIGDTTRSRFDDIHTLFIVGANDGVIPKNSSSGGIISDIEKEFLIEYTPDIELSPTVREQAYTGQLYLYMLMTKPTNSLVISYSRMSGDSDSLRPSYIIKVLKDMFKDLKVVKDFEDISETIYSPVSLYNAIVENLKEEISENLIRTLLSCEDCGVKFADNLKLAVDTAFLQGVLKGNDAISKSVASILYGSSIVGSVTKLEQYARCSFSYFLKYGLSLKERDIFTFEARDMGTVLHAVMEKYTKHVKDLGLKWTDIDDDLRARIVRNLVNECVEDPEFSVLLSTFRHQYMVERIYRISLRSINVLTEHLRAGAFNPKDAEISFSSTSNLESLTFKLSDDEIMRFTGKIDRLDTYSDDEHVYIKIIDYKSGNKTFDIMEVYRGLNLQLVVYMNAATELTARDPQNAGKEIVPAGILYYHIEDPLVDGSLGDREEDIAIKIKKELKMRGLVNSDSNVYSLIDSEMDGNSSIIPVGMTRSGDLSKLSSVASTEEFSVVSNYVNCIMEDLGRNILSGNIKAEPHTVKGADMKACDYCPYTDICKYNEDFVPYDDDVTKETVIEKMKEYLSDQNQDSSENIDGLGNETEAAFE